MSFLLDTDICSAHLRGDRRVFERMTRYGGRIHVSAVSVAELTSWLYRSRTPRRFSAVLNELLTVATTLSIDQNVAEAAGQIVAVLADRGITLGIADAMIAATAKIHDLTVITRYLRHFQPIAEIRIDDWLATS